MTAMTRMKPVLLWLYVRLTGGLLVLLSIILLLIHAQPFENSGLPDLMLADDCAQPCFMGIHPGITTVVEARNALDQRSLVSQWIELPLPVDQTGDTASSGVLRWRWSINRPALFTGLEANLLYNRKSGIVMTFGSMGTRLSLGNLLIELGQPAIGFLNAGINDRDRPIFTHVAGYPQWNFNLVSTIQCPMSLRQLWDAPVTLELTNTIAEHSRFVPYPEHIQPILRRAAIGYC
jgi:hypothetical protein